MEKYTIRPVLDFIAGQGREYITFGDFQQLLAQFRSRSTLNASRPAEELYLRILTGRDFFLGRRRIRTEEFISRIDNFLTQNDYVYSPEIHESCCPANSFYTQQQGRGTAAVDVYDLAFYHPGAAARLTGHHMHNNQGDVFYIRCETRGPRILFGNLQIDDKGKHAWPEPYLGHELRRKKNIYLMMVQQAVKHALQWGHSEILFQGGAAAEIAQWRECLFRRITVTAGNYSQIDKKYQQEIRRFEAEPGHIIKNFKHNEPSEVVIKTTPRRYVTRDLPEETPRLLEKICWLLINKHAHAGDNTLIELGMVAWGVYRKLLAALSGSGDLEKLRQEIHALVTMLTGVTPPFAVGQCATLRAMQKIINREKIQNYALSENLRCRQLLEAYIVRWGYDKILLRHFRAIRRVDLLGPDLKKDCEYIYYNINKRRDNHVYYRKDYQRPVIGKKLFDPQNRQI